MATIIYRGGPFLLFAAVTTKALFDEPLKAIAQLALNLVFHPRLGFPLKGIPSDSFELVSHGFVIHSDPGCSVLPPHLDAHHKISHRKLSALNDQLRICQRGE